MKRIAPLTLLVLLLLSILKVNCQNSVCESDKENQVDLNTISINKCEIEKTKKTTNKISRNRIIRKTPAKISRKKITSNYSNFKGNKINLKTNNKNFDPLKFSIKSKEVLFSLVEEIPLFYSCENLTKEENIKCFKSKINKHFIKNFNPDNFIDESISKKIFIQFQIDIDGKIKNPIIKTDNLLIKNELTSIINNLPQLKAGKIKGLPVVVIYSFPINLTLN